MSLFKRNTKTETATPLPALNVPAAMGDLARDVVTGFVGVVGQWDYHMHGCDRLHLEPRELKADGGCRDGFIFDIMRIEVLEKGVVPVTPPNPAFDNVQPGCIAKDIITGFTGIVDVRSVVFTGNVYVILQPTDIDEKDGEPKKHKAFAVERIKVTKKQAAPEVEHAPKVKRGASMGRKEASVAVRR